MAMRECQAVEEVAGTDGRWGPEHDGEQMYMYIVDKIVCLAMCKYIL